MNSRPRSERIDAVQRESEACSDQLIPARSSRTSSLSHGRAVVSAKATDSQVRSNGQDDVGERASLVPVSGNAHPGGWARNWARVRRHREAMEISRSGEVGGLDRAFSSGDPDRRRLLPGTSWSCQPRTTLPACDWPRRRPLRRSERAPKAATNPMARNSSPARPRSADLAVCTSEIFVVTCPPGTCPRTRGSTTMTSITTESAVRPHPCRRPSNRIRRAICRAVASNPRSKRLTDERPGRDVNS